MTDIDDVIEETNAAIESVTSHADVTWKAAAYGIIKELAAENVDFTSFAVLVRLEKLGVDTHDRRALGGVMRKACRDGIIEATGEYLPHTGRHMTPARVWHGC